MGRDCFENSTSILYAYFPNATKIGFVGGQRGFNNMGNLKKLNIDSSEWGSLEMTH